MTIIHIACSFRDRTTFCSKTFRKINPEFLRQSSYHPPNSSSFSMWQFSETVPTELSMCIYCPRSTTVPAKSSLFYVQTLERANINRKVTHYEISSADYFVL
jgi:hypothetical protein